jgi:hypothetical protein
VASFTGARSIEGAPRNARSTSTTLSLFTSSEPVEGDHGRAQALDHGFAWR